MKLRKWGKSAGIAGAVVAVFAAGLVFGGGSLAASASPFEPDRAATALPANSVGTAQVKDGSLGQSDLYPGFVKALYGVYNSTVGFPALKPEVTSALNSTRMLADAANPQEIGLVGGPIKTNGTKLSMDLTVPAGTYLVTVSGQIDRHQDAAKPGRATQPQLSLWRDKNNNGEFEWQDGEGSISPNCTIPDTTGRSCTVSGSTKISTTATEHWKFVAFGYNGDGSDAGSNELAVSNATLILVPMR